MHEYYLEGNTDEPHAIMFRAMAQGTFNMCNPYNDRARIRGHMFCHRTARCVGWLLHENHEPTDTKHILVSNVSHVYAIPSSLMQRDATIRPDSAGQVLESWNKHHGYVR